MLKVTIELIPFGDLTKIETIKRMIIVNDGTGTPETGNYVYEIDGKKSVLKGFKRAQGAWKLLFKFLKRN